MLGTQAIGSGPDFFNNALFQRHCLDYRVQNQIDTDENAVVSNPPSTLDEWERLLVGYFLAVGPDGDASDIHSFEVTRSTLTFACGLDASREGEVEAAFRNVLIQDPLLVETLRHGSQRFSTSEVPQFFVCLAMTLFIDSLLDGKYRTKGAFRAKMADWLGADRGFTDLKGIAAMWEELVSWLDKRATMGASFRRLLLPDPGGWTQIGYTRRLSFPNRHDIKLVEHLLRGNNPDLNNTAMVIHALQPLLFKDSASIGLREAYDDFRKLYFLHRRAIAEHRFWRLVARVRSGLEKNASSLATLDLTFNENGEMEFRSSVHGGGEIRGHASIGAALATASASSSANLGPAIARGILFFRQVGMGLWQVEPDHARCLDLIYVAFAPKHKDAIGQRLGPLFGDPGWLITAQPKPITVVDIALTQARILAGTDEKIFRPRVIGGVRVRGAWLGLPRYLPTIEADASELVVFSSTAGAPNADAVRVKGVVQLVADSSLNGIYTVEPEPHRDERSVPWRLRMQFVDRALPHIALEGTRSELPRLSDWTCIEAQIPLCDDSDRFDWEPGNESMANLLEAIYADGRSGWDEADLVDLVRRASPELMRNPWPMLRLLQDGGVIEPRLRQGWKGRVWTLIAPRLVTVRHASTDIVILEGALCSRMLDDFELAVQGLRGHCFRRQSAKQWSVPIVGATDLSPALLADQLGWPLVTTVNTAGAVPLALEYTNRHAEYYRIASVWCWRMRCFLSAGAEEGPVRLIRRSHQSGTDHDVYCVEYKGRWSNHLSRCAAIVAAHAVAAVPLFEYCGGHIVRLSHEGALPDVLAATLRRRRLSAAEMDGQRYSYPASEADVRWLMSMLPGCIVGLEIANPQTSSTILSSIRRSGGRLRPGWRHNRLVVQPMLK
jgi:hypothetical protein